MAKEQDIESLLAEISRSQSSASFPSDTMTAAILERLREEVQRVYQDSQTGEGGGSGEIQAGGTSSTASPRAKVHVRHPLPVELWKKAHEVEGKPKTVRAQCCVSSRAPVSWRGAARPLDVSLRLRTSHNAHTSTRKRFSPLPPPRP